MSRRLQIVIEKHSDGFVAYPVGMKGVVVGEGDTSEAALADVKSAIRFHIETFGREVFESKSPLYPPMIRSLFSLAVSSALGALLWALSKPLTGRLEPWDAEGAWLLYYPLGLVLAGLLAGAITGRIWAVWAGIVLGQMAYALWALPADPLMLLGLGFLLAYSVLALAGAALGRILRGLQSRLSRHALPSPPPAPSAPASPLRGEGKTCVEK